MGLQKRITEKERGPDPAPCMYSGYVALLCDFIDKEPSNYEEVAERKEWKDAIIKDY